MRPKSSGREKKKKRNSEKVLLLFPAVTGVPMQMHTHMIIPRGKVTVFGREGIETQKKGKMEAARRSSGPPDYVESFLDRL